MRQQTAYDSATIPSNYSRLIARELGLSVKQLPALLTNTGISAEQFLDEALQLTAIQQVHILENALNMADADFGLRLGHQLTPTTHGAMGFLAYSSANLRAALHAVRLFTPTRMSFARIELKDTGDSLECYGYFDLEMTEAVRRCLSETFAVMFFEMASSILGRPLHEVTTYFAHAAPSYHAQYADYLPGSHQFGMPQFMVRIPAHVCDEANISANHESYTLALQQCQAMLAQLDANQSYRYRVQKMMLSHPPGTLREADAAAALFMSKRTLARKLGEESTGFRQIREEILSQQAVNYLRDTTLTIDAIAALLNYHDSANFRRAFKRWFEIAPDSYRQLSVAT